MPKQLTVLLLGGTGRTGRRVLEQLLSRGIKVRAVVRSAHKLRGTAADECQLTIVESGVLSMNDEDLMAHLRGCDAVISCLGHVLSFRGIFGAPRHLVTQVASRVCTAIEVLQPATPVKFVLMSSVSVNHPMGLGTRRGSFEKVILWLLRGLLPPARDNQRAADFLCRNIGTSHPFVQWVAVRPDTLVEGEVSEYTLHENLVSSLFAPDSSTMANVAQFMCELVANPAAWNDWQGKLPVIVNAKTPKR